MSSQKLRLPGRLLAIVSAALLIQIGGAAAANRPDIQGQMRAVLSGVVPAHALPQPPSARDLQSESGADAQAFARRLLQGWSASAVASARPATQRHRAADLRKPVDIQAMVRRQLLGV